MRTIGLKIATANSSRNQCPYCCKTYASQEKLDVHIAKEHADKLNKQ